MPTAHSSLLQWLQDQPEYYILRVMAPTELSPFWLVSVHIFSSFGASYEDACYELLQIIRKS